MEKKFRNLESQNSIKLSSKIVKFLQKIEGKYKMKISEILENEKISFEDFKNILLKINGVILKKPKNQQKISKTVIVRDQNYNICYHPPKDKEKHLQRLYEIFNSDETLKDKAMIMFYAIQFIHPFDDGNGRTGRFLYELISKNYNINNENFELILQNIRWRSYFELPQANKVLEYIDWNFFKTLNLTKMPNGISSGLVRNPDSDIVCINLSLENSKLYKTSSWILRDNYSHKLGNFSEIILFKINEKKKYAESRENEHTGKASFDGKKVMESLQEDDLQYIIDEYEKYQDDRMNYFFDNIKQIYDLICKVGLTKK